MGKMATRQIYLQVLQFSSPPTQNINRRINNNLIRETSRRCLENCTRTLSKICGRWTRKDLPIPLYKALTDSAVYTFHLLIRLQTFTFKYACLTKTMTSYIRQAGSLDTEEAPRRLWQQWQNSLVHEIWLRVPAGRRGAATPGRPDRLSVAEGYGLGLGV